MVAVLDGATEARIITDYTGSSKVAAVTPNWNTTPDSDDSFIIYLPEGIQLTQANVSHWNSLATVALPLTPTTAGRALDVSAGGNAGIDWANVEAPTTALNLSATNIDVDQVVASVSGAVGSVTGAVGSVTGAVGSVTGHTAQTGDNFARLGAPAGASIAADLAAIEAQTDDIGAAGAGLTALASAANLATLDGKVDTVDNFLDTEIAALIALSYTRTGTAQAGGATTITLDAGAPVTDDLYNNQIIVITAGTGAGQARFIADYTGSSRIATVTTWVTNPSSDSVFYILPFGAIPGATAPTATEIRQELDANSTKLDATISSRATPAQVNTEADTALTDYGALKPTVGGRTLDVSAGGEADANLVQVGGSTTSVSALATSIATLLAGAVVGSGTADSGTTMTMVDAARTEADANYWLWATLLFTSGTLAGQGTTHHGVRHGDGHHHLYPTDDAGRRDAHVSHSRGGAGSGCRPPQH